MTVISKLRLGHKLSALMLGLAGLTILAVALPAYKDATTISAHKSEERLQSIVQGRAREVGMLVGQIERDLTDHAHAIGIEVALSQFSKAYGALASPVDTLQDAYIDGNPHPVGQKQNLSSAGSETVYDVLHGRYHARMREIQEALGYYDVFLIDAEGNIVYSVFKERDYATNLVSGPYRDSGLATAFKDANALGADAAPAFSEFAPYAPSNGAAAAFVAMPVFGGEGERLGVLAYQLPVDVLSSVVDVGTELGQTGEMYLTADHGFMHTDSPRTEENDVLATRVGGDFIDTALSGEEASGITTDHRGLEVLQYAVPLNAFGANWAVVGSEATDELFAATAKLKRDFLIIGGIVLAVVAVVAIFISRSIARPISGLETAMQRIAHDDFDLEVPATGRHDEIGTMARTLQGFQQSLAGGAQARKDAAYKGAAFQASSTQMMLVDQDFNITHMNKSMHDLLGDFARDFGEVTSGLQPNEMIGVNMDRFHKVPSAIRAKLAQPGALPFKTVIRVGTTFFSLSADAVHDETGERIGVVLEWKNETRAMRDQTIMKALDAGSVRLEIYEDGKVGWANSFVCKLAGCETADMVGKTGDSALSYADESGASVPMKTLIANRTVVEGDFTLHLPDRDVLVDGSITPMLDAQGKPNGFVLVGADVTEERAALAAAEAERARVSAAQQLVVDNLRHSLNALSQGDLTARIDTAFSSEYEQLRSDFNMATGKLLDAIGAMIDSAGSIQADTNHISQASQSLSKRTETQAATLEETAAALDKLTQSVRTAAEEANTAATKVQSTRENVETSGGVVHEAVGAMGQIEKFSNEISSISGVIDEIAFQTNLLALNAGVEAARAGEAGRGFAVVASEVRALAQRSSDAAREINTLISSSGAQIKKGVALVSQAGDVLNEMMSSVSDIAGSVQSIAESARDQSRGLQEINSAVSGLDQVTQHNAAMFEQTSAASLALAGEADTLARTMGQFRTSRDVETPDRMRAAS